MAVISFYPVDGYSWYITWVHVLVQPQRSNQISGVICPRLADAHRLKLCINFRPRGGSRGSKETPILSQKVPKRSQKGPKKVPKGPLFQKTNPPFQNLGTGLNFWYPICIGCFLIIHINLPYIINVHTEYFQGTKRIYLWATNWSNSLFWLFITYHFLYTRSQCMSLKQTISHLKRHQL